MDKSDTPKSFGEFLDATKAHDNPAGDFVRDARTDSLLRQMGAAQKWDDVAWHLHTHGACTEAEEAGRIV